MTTLLMPTKPRRRPSALRPIVATLCLLYVLAASIHAQAAAPTAEPIDWKWALTQGGLTLFSLVMAWSYRKDMQRWADDRVRHEREIAELKAAHARELQEHRDRATEERIAFNQARVDEAMRYNRHLEQLLDRTNDTLKATAEALSSHTTALARNTDSTHRLANAVEKLDSRMERVEHGK